MWWFLAILPLFQYFNSVSVSTDDVDDDEFQNVDPNINFDSSVNFTELNKIIVLSAFAVGFWNGIK